MASCPAVASHRLEAAMARSIWTLKQDRAGRSNPPFQRMVVVLVLGQGKYARTLSTYLEADNATGIVAAVVQDTLNAMDSRWIVALDILVGMEGNLVVDMTKRSAGVDGNSGKVDAAMLTESWGC